MIWRPDTCGCVLSFNGSANTADLFESASRVCSLHQTLQGVDIVNAVLEDNIKKNVVLKELADSLPEVAREVVGRIPEESHVMINEDAVEWYFDENRKLIITIKATLPPNIKKEDIQTDIAKNHSGIEIR